MAKYTIRVELHAEKQADKNVLILAMEKEGFSQIVKEKKSKAEFYLPNFEFTTVKKNQKKEQVLNKAKTAASKVGSPFSVLVTKASDRIWYGLKKVEKEPKKEKASTGKSSMGKVGKSTPVKEETKVVAKSDKKVTAAKTTSKKANPTPAKASAAKISVAKPAAAPKKATAAKPVAAAKKSTSKAPVKKASDKETTADKKKGSL